MAVVCNSALRMLATTCHSGCVVNHLDPKEIKKQNILDVVNTTKSKVHLRRYALMKYGLIDNEARTLVWPILVDAPDECDIEELDPNLLESHPSRYQVELDTNRMASLLPEGISEAESAEIKAAVTRLVLSLLVDNPSTHYYQGFHDVCYIFFSVLGEKKSRAVLNKLIPTRFSLFMQETLDGTVEHMELILALLGHIYPSILDDIESVGLGPHFAISWIITWFAHVLPNMDDVRRLYDLFLATDALMVIYLCVSIIVRSEEKVQSTPPDFGLLHQTLLRLPKLHPVEDLVRHAQEIYITVPPTKLLELGQQRLALRRTPAPISNKTNRLNLINHLTRNRFFLFGVVGSVVIVLIARVWTII